MSSVQIFFAGWWPRLGSIYQLRIFCFSYRAAPTTSRAGSRAGWYMLWALSKSKTTRWKTMATFVVGTPWAEKLLAGGLGWAKTARMILIKTQPSIEFFINKLEKIVTKPQSFRQEMGRDFWAWDKPSATYSTRWSPFEPLSAPSEDLIAVRMGILIKSVVEDFQVINTKLLAGGRKSPVKKISGLCMPYGSAGCLPQVMLQDTILSYEVSLTISYHN